LPAGPTACPPGRPLVKPGLTLDHFSITLRLSQWQLWLGGATVTVKDRKRASATAVGWGYPGVCLQPLTWRSSCRRLGPGKCAPSLQATTAPAGTFQKTEVESVDSGLSAESGACCDDGFGEMLPSLPPTPSLPRTLKTTTEKKKTLTAVNRGTRGWGCEWHYFTWFTTGPPASSQ
jgi:hypothetical protein